MGNPFEKIIGRKTETENKDVENGLPKSVEDSDDSEDSYDSESSDEEEKHIQEMMEFFIEMEGLLRRPNEDEILPKLKCEMESKSHASASASAAATERRPISPLGNTELHIAALCGKDEWVESKSHLLAKKNANDDTALHVAARAKQIPTLEKLLAALLRKLPYSEKPKEALDEILAKNKQGNTFFHEALLNRRKDVMKILDSQELQIEAGFKELVERAALFWTNKEEKSVLHLAIEKGYKDIVGDALTRLASSHTALDELIQNHPELGELSRQQDQGKEMKKQQQDNTTTDTLEEPESRINSLYYNPFMVAIDREIMNSKYNFEKMSPENGKHEINGQDSPTNKFIENDQEVAQLIPYGPHYVPPGKLPLAVAIIKQNQGILKKILKRKKEWIRLRDSEGRTALHYAASIGYLDGVKCLLKDCNSSSQERNEDCISYNLVRDNEGFYALHLASAGGHAKVVKKLLEHRHGLYPREILDKYGRNIVHIAAEMGQFNVVRYILQYSMHGLVKMVNDKDCNGNTPLHLATLHCHPKIVQALTWHERVDLCLGNSKNQTALDIYMQLPQENPSLRQRLIRIALESAGAKRYAETGSHSIKIPRRPQSAENVYKQEGQNKDPPTKDQYKDRINTLMLVSTLITTVTFAAGFTLPGGTNSSDPEKGMSLMLNHMWFRPFIFCITISMYGAISATIVLNWAQLGDITLTRLALKVAMPLLGITLTTLSVAFLAGVHLVISDLSWLATSVLVLCVICILVLSLLYILLWFFSSSRNPLLRYIFYYPFRFLTWLVEQGEKTEARFVDSSWSATREGEGKGRMEEGSKG